MKRLDGAKEWYEGRLQALVVVDDWMRGRPPVPEVLQPLVRDFYDKKEGPARFKREREDLKRVALVRIFAGFEADFRERFAEWLKAQFDQLRPAQAGDRNAEEIGTALPGSIESCVNLFRALEPRFSRSDKGWLDELRRFRNDVMHGGFQDLVVKEDPRQAHARLQRILRHFDEPGA